MPTEWHQLDQLPSTENISKAIDFSIDADVECTLINCSHADMASNSISEPASGSVISRQVIHLKRKKLIYQLQQRMLMLFII